MTQTILVVEDQEDNKQILRDLLGSVDTGISDLGQHHREHMIRRLRRGQ